MGVCRPHNHISVAHQSSQTWKMQKIRTQFPVAMCFLCSFWGNFGSLNCLVRVTSWTYIRSFYSTPDGSRMVEKNSVLLTGYAWVGFQYTKCSMIFFLGRKELINLICAFILAVCVVCHILLFHCGVRRLQEQCIFSSFASNSTGNIFIKRKVKWFIPFFPNSIQKYPVNIPDEGRRLSRVLLGHLVPAPHCQNVIHGLVIGFVWSTALNVGDASWGVFIYPSKFEKTYNVGF